MFIALESLWDLVGGDSGWIQVCFRSAFASKTPTKKNCSVGSGLEASFCPKAIASIIASIIASSSLYDSLYYSPYYNWISGGIADWVYSRVSSWKFGRVSSHASGQESGQGLPGQVFG